MNNIHTTILFKLKEGLDTTRGEKRDPNRIHAAIYIRSKFRFLTHTRASFLLCIKVFIQCRIYSLNYDRNVEIIRFNLTLQIYIVTVNRSDRIDI